MTRRPTVVAACLRDGEGGSPTAVLIDDATLTGGALTDGARLAIARTAGASHTVFADTSTDPPTLRFFTSAGELRNCGHGTIAAQAVLLHRGGATRHRGRLRTGDRIFAVTAVRRRYGIEAWFDQGVIALRDHDATADRALLAALGLEPGDLAAAPRVASPGTPRLLVPLPNRGTLSALRPDFARLAAECRRHGYLGCFAYAVAPGATTAAARMFAPAIGVDEDIVNANSAGCLAAHLLDTGRAGRLDVHQGDALGRPSTVCATARHTRHGIAASIGGLVRHPAPLAVGRSES